MRPLQFHPLAKWRPHIENLEQILGLDQKFVYHLKWWMNPNVYTKGVPLQEPKQDFQIFTDASHVGWGAHIEPLGLLTQRLWSEEDKILHINNLEMKAVFLAIQHWSRQINGCCVMIVSDNTTVVLYLKRHGDPFSIPVHGSLGHPHMVSEKENHFENQTHTWQVQCERRQSVSFKQSSTDKMVNLSNCAQSGILDVGTTNVGPICDSVQQQTASVCVSRSGPHSLGSGCVVFRVERPIFSRVSTIQNDSPGTEQNQQNHLHDNPDSSTVASAVMVQRPVRACHSKTNSASVQGRPLNTSEGDHLSPQHRNARPSRLEIIRQSIRDRKFSEYAISCISNAKRESTNKVYSLKWNKFCHWCSGRQINAVDPPPPPPYTRCS